jgi:regulator of nonsense transcripts 3
MATSSSDGPIKLSKRIEKELHQTKVVIRKLPPDLTEEKLLDVLSGVPSYSYFYFAAGDPSLGVLSFSRAYFTFTEEASILPFRDKYDGCVLESESGLKYKAVVEFAPYQGVPKQQKRKPDARMGTIEQDPDYMTFVEASETQTKPPSMAELSAYIDTIGSTKVSEVQKTPLIDYLLKSGRSGKRGKSSTGDSKRRQKESSKSAKETRKESGSYRNKESRSKKDGGRDRTEKKKDEVSKVMQDDRPRSSEKQHREKSSRDRKGHHYEENGEVRADGERKTNKEYRVKNRDRPDQAFYSPRSQGKQRGHGEGKEAGRREESRSYTKDGSTDRGKSEREYGSEEKPRRGYGREIYTGKEKRYDGGKRSDDYRKDSYGHHESSRSYSYREK